MPDTSVRRGTKATNAYVPRHLGQIYITHGSLAEMDALLDIDSTDVQGKLRDDGVFDRLHQIFLSSHSIHVTRMGAFT